MLASNKSSEIYPVAIIKVLNGNKCRALLDTDTGSSYASEGIIDLLKINPIRKKYIKETLKLD